MLISSDKGRGKRGLWTILIVLSVLYVLHESINGFRLQLCLGKMYRIFFSYDGTFAMPSVFNSQAVVTSFHL